MEWVKNIYTSLEKLDEKKFYRGILIFLVSITLCCFGLMFYYYRKTHDYYKKIEEINEYREQIKTILDKAQHVRQQQKTLDDIIAQDENFKIGAFFTQLIDSLKLSSKQSQKAEITSPKKEGKYQETTLNAKFTGLSMKELATLLQKIDENKRVYTKELEITVSKKQPNTIDVSLAVATLEPKQESFEESA